MKPVVTNHIKEGVSKYKFTTWQLLICKLSFSISKEPTISLLNNEF